jgi:hypothetical protein
MKLIDWNPIEAIHRAIDAGDVGDDPPDITETQLVFLESLDDE